MKRASKGLHSEINDLGKVRVDPVPAAPSDTMPVARETVDSTAALPGSVVDLLPLPVAVDNKGRGQLTRGRRPPWLRVRSADTPRFRELKQLFRGKSLNTVCEEAMCPNIGECWGRGTATFLLMGDTCTRSLRLLQDQDRPPRPARPGGAAARGRERAGHEPATRGTDKRQSR